MGTHIFLHIVELIGWSSSTEPPTGRQNADHIRIIVLFGAGISRPEIRAGSALAAVAGPGRRTTIKIVPLNAKPCRHRQAQQSQSQPSTLWADGQATGRWAEAQVGRAARRRLSERKQPPCRSQRCSPAASAAPLPPQHMPVYGVDPWLHGAHGCLHWRSRLPLLPAGRCWTLPRTMCYNAFYRQRGEDV